MVKDIRNRLAIIVEGPSGRGQSWQIAALALVCSLLMLSPGRAMADCDVFYRVQRGDTLQLIASREIGNDDFQAVFQSNIDILRDPSRIEVGQLLYLPCPGLPLDRPTALIKAGISPTPRDDVGDRLALTMVRSDRDGETAGTGPTTRTAPGAVLKILTGSGRAPLVDRGLPSNGMALLIVGEALKAASDPRVIRPEFVDDWKSHLDVLMPTGAFSLALPWPRPDCDADDLSATARGMCDAFLFSEAFYEIPVSILAPVDSPLVDARSEKSLAGRTICRPQAFPPVDLEKIPVPLRIVVAPSGAECARMVLNGEADAISLPAPAAVRLLNQPRFSKTMMKSRYLDRSVPVHAVALKRDPEAAALIGRFDAGLRQIQASGRWLDLISSYIRQIEKPALSQ